MVPLTQSWMQQCLSLLHYMVSHQEHPWNLLAKIFSQRRRKLLKWWPHSSSITLSGHISAVHLNLLHHEEHLSYYPEATKRLIFKSCCGKQPIVKVLQVSQETSQTLDDSFVYQLLLKAILPHLSYLMWSVQGNKCSREICGCHKQHANLQLSW